MPRAFHEYAAACGDLVLDATGDLGIAVEALAHDSRRVRPGSIFVAVNGARVDGRAYIDEALSRGAVGVVYQAASPLALPVPTLRVSSDYAALGRLAECHGHWPGRRLRCIGVTGTNGKTSICWLLRHLLNGAGRRVGLLGTVAADVGAGCRPAERTTPTPLTLQSLLAQAVETGREAVVMEVSSHALVQRRMGTLRYEVAAFTNLTQDHLDYHGDMAAYYAAKRRLFLESLAPDGTAVVDVDSAYGKRLATELRQRDIRCLTCGTARDAALRATSCECRIDGATIRLADGTAIESPLLGQFNVRNVLVACAAARAYGLSPAQTAAAIASFAGVPGRLERVRNDRGLNVIVDYAHTPDALRCVLSTLRPLCPGRLLTVFGCGGDRDRRKRPLMGGIAAAFSDALYVTSDNPRSERPEGILDDICAGMPPAAAPTRVCDRRAAIGGAIAAAAPGDTLLIAGKGHEDYQETGRRRRPFDDRLVAREFLHA